jgi:hypothetical protein
MTDTWTEQQDQRLVMLFNDGYSKLRIANALGKSRGQVRRRARRLKLKPRATWTKEKERKAFELWKAGYSQNRIAAELGNVTVGAVAGKISRLGRIARPLLHGLEGPKPQQERGAKPTSRERGAKPIFCSLFELKAESCRWPYGDAAVGFTFCGAPEADIDKNRPYCAAHMRGARNS